MNKIVLSTLAEETKRKTDQIPTEKKPNSDCERIKEKKMFKVCLDVFFIEKLDQRKTVTDQRGIQTWSVAADHILRKLNRLYCVDMCGYIIQHVHISLWFSLFLTSFVSWSSGARPVDRLWTSH